METQSAVKSRPYLWRWPPRKILVPLDATPESLAGWRHAQDLVKRFGAKAEVLVVQPWNLALAGYPIVEPEMAVELAGREAARLHRELGAVVHAAEGPVDMTITTRAAKGYGLIVMATHTRGLARLLSGSVAEAVVREAPIPVLVARAEPKAVRTILAPVNFEEYSRDALTIAAETAASYGARLEVLHVAPESLGRHWEISQVERKLEQWIDELPRSVRQSCRPSGRFVFGSPAEQIVLASRGASLVVLAAHRRGLLADTVLGTTAERVLRHSPAPVLAVPSRAAP